MQAYYLIKLIDTILNQQDKKLLIFDKVSELNITAGTMNYVFGLFDVRTYQWKNEFFQIFDKTGSGSSEVLYLHNITKRITVKRGHL
jgi:hypothetical protein